MSVQKAIRLRVRATEQVTVVTSGVPVNPTLIKENTEAVRIINNTANIVYVGSQQSGVDGASNPPKGIPLYQGDSGILYTSHSPLNRANTDIYIDADTDGTEVTVQLLGV